MSMCRAALIAAGMTLAGALAAHAADPAEVLQLVLKAEAGCRGSNDPDSPATKRACDEWGVRSEQLEKLGWCYWWPIDKIHADPEVRWRPCSPAERYANAHQKPVKTSADDQQRVAAAEARCKAAAGGPPAAQRAACAEWVGLTRQMRDGQPLVHARPAPGPPTAPPGNEWSRFLSDELLCEVREREAGVPPAATRCAWTQQGVDWKGIGRN